jgi:hypothetical protein
MKGLFLSSCLPLFAVVLSVSVILSSVLAIVLPEFVLLAFSGVDVVTPDSPEKDVVSPVSTVVSPMAAFVMLSPT